MKITDLKTEESAQVGDTILSSRDLSLKYIDRTNTQFLNKLEYPKLWEIYKTSTGDRFIDKNIFNTTVSTQKIDFIETENSYMVLQSPNILDLKFYNKNLNLLSTKTSGLTSNTFLKKICGDNQYILVCDNGNTTNVKLHYSTNFNIDNQTVGTFTEKIMNSRTHIVFVNNNFIISMEYGSATLVFKLNKTYLSRINEITGDFATDSLLDFVLINSITFLSTNNLSLTTFSLTANSIVFLENGDIYIYNNSDKKVVKTNQLNPYFLEIYENLTSDLAAGGIVSFCYYKNSFLMTFIKTASATSHYIFLINDDGVKIKNDSSINNNLNRPSGFCGELYYIDFINKKIITPGLTNIVYYNDFSMNQKSINVFNILILNVFFDNIGKELFNNTYNNIFMNKNPIIIRIKSEITLENGSNQYDIFRADFIKGTFPDNFTMPAIVGNTKDKYWTKKG